MILQLHNLLSYVIKLFLHGLRGHGTMFVFGGEAEDRAIAFLNRKNQPLNISLR